MVNLSRLVEVTLRSITLGAEDNYGLFGLTGGKLHSRTRCWNWFIWSGLSSMPFCSNSEF